MERTVGMLVTGADRSTRRENCPNATLSTTNPTRFHLGSNPRFHVVGIATRYELDGRGIESQWDPRFSAPVQSPIQWVSGHSRW
jgi:hypothetical protein